MKIKLYRKIIRPIIRYAHDEYPPKIDKNWYDDNEIIREGIISRFEKESDGYVLSCMGRKVCRMWYD